MLSWYKPIDEVHHRKSTKYPDIDLRSHPFCCPTRTGRLLEEELSMDKLTLKNANPFRQRNGSLPRGKSFIGNMRSEHRFGPVEEIDLP